MAYARIAVKRKIINKIFYHVNAKLCIKII